MFLLRFRPIMKKFYYYTELFSQSVEMTYKIFYWLLIHAYDKYIIILVFEFMNNQSSFICCEGGINYIDDIFDNLSILFLFMSSLTKNAFNWLIHITTIKQYMNKYFFENIIFCFFFSFFINNINAIQKLTLTNSF